MIKNTIKLLSLIVGLTILGCQQKSVDLTPLDLLSHGLAVKVNAPADAKVKVEDLGIVKDVTIQDSLSGYNLQIFESAATSLDSKNIAADLKAEAEASSFFDEIVKSEEDGFIYKKVIDENYINYDFRHVKVRGDKQYVFRAGLSRQYTLEQIETMYNSVL